MMKDAIKGQNNYFHAKKNENMANTDDVLEQGGKGSEEGTYNKNFALLTFVQETIEQNEENCAKTNQLSHPASSQLEVYSLKQKYGRGIPRIIHLKVCNLRKVK